MRIKRGSHGGWLPEGGNKVKWFKYNIDNSFEGIMKNPSREIFS
jgi:hypothetical protein